MGSPPRLSHPPHLHTDTVLDRWLDFSQESMTLILGKPRSGKTTLLRELARQLSRSHSVLFVSSAHGLMGENGYKVITATSVEDLRSTLNKVRPEILVVDDAQNMRHFNRGALQAWTASHTPSGVRASPLGGWSGVLPYVRKFVPHAFIGFSLKDVAQLKWRPPKNEDQTEEWLNIPRSLHFYATTILELTSEIHTSGDDELTGVVSSVRVKKPLNTTVPDFNLWIRPRYTFPVTQA